MRYGLYCDPVAPAAPLGDLPNRRERRHHAQHQLRGEQPGGVLAAWPRAAERYSEAFVTSRTENH